MLIEKDSGSIDNLVQAAIIAKDGISRDSVEIVFRAEFGKKREKINDIVSAFYYSKSYFEKHKMKRLCGNPFFIHQYAAAKILQDIGTPDEAIIAALLHDVIEESEEKGDRKEVERYITQRHGKDMLELVRIVSTGLNDGKYHDKLNSMLEQIEEIKNGENPCIKNQDLAIVPLMVKFSDAIDNINTVYSSRKDLYSDNIDYRSEDSLKLCKQRKLFNNAYEVLYTFLNYLNGKSCKYEKETKSLFFKLRDSFADQIQNEMQAVSNELKALSNNNPEGYKMTALKSFLGEKIISQNPDLREAENFEGLYDKLKGNFKESRLIMPRHSYLFNQFSKEITSKDMGEYRFFYGFELEYHLKELKEINGRFHDMIPRSPF